MAESSETPYSCVPFQHSTKLLPGVLQERKGTDGEAGNPG